MAPLSPVLLLITLTLLRLTSSFTTPILLERRQALLSFLVLLDERPTSTVPSGVQFSDARIGGGSLLQGSGLFHIRALLRDGSVLFDTRDDGGPMLVDLDQYSDGFIPSSGSIGKITPGLAEALQGIKEGGIRLVVVPSESGYGNAGKSRYRAYQQGFKKPVPRDEMLRYEVEVLRCLPVEPKGDGELTFQACCTEPNYPCKADEEASSE